MSPANVLLVEDDLDISELITETLRRADLVVHAVGSGEAAVAHVDAHPVDLVILDIVLPGMDGWDVLHAIRDRPALGELPVLVVSVLDSSDRHVEPHVAYLPKPFRPAELARLVQHLLVDPTEGLP